jgi:hypothetical protein
MKCTDFKKILKIVYVELSLETWHSDMGTCLEKKKEEVKSE